MNGPSHRLWMYRRIDTETGELRDEFINGVEAFDKFARSQQEFMVNNVYRCPCTKCKNTKYLTPDVVKLHLYRKGFVQNYWVWTSHGEVEPSHYGEGTSSNIGVHFNMEDPNFDDDDGSGYTHHHMETMVNDVFGWDNDTPVSGRNVQAENFYNMLESAQQPLFEGCSTHSELSAAMRLLSIKSEHNISNRCFNDVVHLMQETTPTPNRIPSNFNAVKKKVKELGLDYKSIHCCPNGCMIYWKEDVALVSCKFCGSDRFKSDSGGRQRSPLSKMHYMPLIPRLQRLFASKRSAEHMTWHKNHVPQDGFVSHPSEAKAWKHFDRHHPSFAAEARNVRLGLCADGFNPYSNAARPYSVWPIVVCVYNLPPHMCMTRPYMFLSTVIPGPQNPKSKIDVYLQPLIDELKM
uniref:Transposase-associated domain-containing protein n=1 Tax=Opuntia streptacantha TaxID=393608 RepID=A0A7C9DL29_OPUST